MSRFGLTLQASLACLIGAAAVAPAQYVGNPFNRPRVSPYINLLRGGASPGINYFGIVRPEVEARAAIGQVAQQAQQNQQAITGLQNAPTGPPTTGHAFGFQTHNQYFMNLSSGGASGSPGFGLGAAAGGAARGGMGGQSAGRSAAAPRPAGRGR